jgi:gluconate transporter
MPLVFVGIGIIVLLILMMKFKFNAFLSLLITSFVVGLLNSMGLIDVLNSILKGIGDTMGSIVLILVFGAMLGKLIEESGAAHTITYKLTELFGLKNIQYAVLITGFLVGLPMMYNASFLVLIPLIYTLSTTTRLPLMYLGIPLSAALGVAHGYLPPHPAPTYVSILYEANINQVLLLGLIASVPACLTAGILLSKFFKNVDVKPPSALHEDKEFRKEELPGLGISVFTAVIPVILMLFGAVIDMVFGNDIDFVNLFSSHFDNHLIISGLAKMMEVFKFLSNPNIALLMAVFAGMYLLGIRQGKKMDDVMNMMGKSISTIAMIVMVISAGGAFKQVIADGGVADYIKQIAIGINFNPLVLAWSVAAILRLAVGSATVATMTAAGIMLPIVTATNVSPELMVIATGSGSLMFSHFNDIGFWMFKEYYNLSIKQTFAMWTVMETIIAVIGLAAVLLFSIFI